MSTRAPIVFVILSAVLLMTILTAGASPKTATPSTTCQPSPAPVVEAGQAAEQIPVLLYHDLAPEALGTHRQNAMVVPAEGFVQQMEWLATEGYYTPTLAELADFLEGRRDLPERSVIITFDDGYESNYYFAHFALCKLGMRAVLFKIGARTPNYRPFNPIRRTHLTWDQANEMVHSGVWEIENHTFKGHDMIGGKAPLIVWDKLAIVADLAQVDKLWTAQGLRATTAIAYPFGAYDEETIEAVGMTNLQLGFTIEPGRVTPGMDRLRLPRLAIYPQHSLEAFAQLVRPASP